MRLNKFLAHAGVASRRQCDELIFNGRVEVNSYVIETPGTDIDPDKDEIRVDGDRVYMVRHLTYVKLHKPEGYITSKSDPHNSKTVMELLPNVMQHLVPVGRLDKDTTGVLIFTDDGDLVHKLIHPRFEIEKEYWVQLVIAPVGFPENELPDGIQLDGDEIARGFCEPVNSKRTRYRVVLKEGKRREVKRIFRHYNTKVKYLHRRLFAGITADDLEPGKWKKLSGEEIKKIMGN